MSPWGCPGFGGSHSFPRVSGDEPATKDDWRELAVFSPRERG